jgi:hypothetical protein
VKMKNKLVYLAAALAVFVTLFLFTPGVADKYCPWFKLSFEAVVRSGKSSMTAGLAKRVAEGDFDLKTVNEVLSSALKSKNKDKIQFAAFMWTEMDIYDVNPGIPLQYAYDLLDSDDFHTRYQLLLVILSLETDESKKRKAEADLHAMMPALL